MKKHKHAEVLGAIANGREVEFLDPDTRRWQRRVQHCLAPNPLVDEHLDWRVGTEPKPDVVMQTFLKRVNHIVYNEANYNDERANIRVTFDGQTGALKKAEVLDPK